MGRYILAFAALLFSTTAHAHVSAVPFPEVGSLQDVHKAAFAIFQTYSGPPQITCNIVTGVASASGPCVSPAATCNGDVQSLTRTVTITNSGAGNRNVAVTVNTFSSGDVGKIINITGAGAGGGIYTGTIATFTDAQHIVLGSNVSTVLTATSTAVVFGTDDAATFRAFNTWAQANQGSNQVVLTIPNGSNCWFATSQQVLPTTLDNAFAAGINNFLVEGTGATINSVGSTTGFQLGGQGIIQVGLTAVGGKSARINTATAGDTTVTLTSTSFSAGYISRFTAGQWIMIGGLDTQGLFQAPFGFPPNLNYFEWRQMTNVNAGTGVITLDRALSNSYCSCWPEFNAGNAFEVDSSGPATIFAVNSSWPVTVEYRGLTISQTGQTYSQGRNVTFRNVTFTGSNGAIPTQNESWSAINTSFVNVQMELDKLVGTMTLDGVTIVKIAQQSSATDRMIIRNTTFSLGLDGGGKYTEITDSALGFWSPGIGAYGALGTANETICTRCVVGALGINYGFSNSETPAFWTKASGVITMPLAAAQGSGPGQRFFVPDARIYYNVASTNPPTLFACCSNMGSFKVGTITSDPWPALDNQTTTTNVTIGLASKSLTVSSSIFSSGDVGKTIIVNGAEAFGNPLRTWITAFNSATSVNLYNAAGTALIASSQTVQWGTSNMYVQTNQSGAFPDVTAISTNALGLRSGGIWKFTCDTCTGDPNAVAVSVQAGATPAAPLGTYASRTYTPTSAQGDLGALPVMGVFKSLRINVTAAATAASAVALSFGQFHWILIDQSTPSALAMSDWLPSNLAINLKQTGDRVITPSGVTCNGAAGGCSGDTITPPASLATIWVQHNSAAPYMGSTFTGAPTFTITMTTDTLQ